MPFGDDSEKKGAPTTWAAATSRLRGAMKAGGSEAAVNRAMFGEEGDPLTASRPEAFDYLDRPYDPDKGTNTGAHTAKRLTIRRMGTGDHFARGFRSIPGNASTGYVDRKTRAVMNAIDAKLGGTVASGPIDAPVGQPLRTLAREARAAAKPATGIASLRPKRR